MQDDPFLDEPEAPAEPEAAPGPEAQPEGQADGEAAGAEDETVESDIATGTESAVHAANPATSAIKVKTRVEVDFTAEPYVPGQCTIILALAIRPDDGHPDGRLVVLGARSHDEAPILITARLNTLQLPEPLAQLLADYEAQLPRRGVVKAEARAKEAAEKKAAEERRQASASRKGAATAKAKHNPAAKAEIKPAVEKPAAKPASAQVSLFGA